MKKSISDREKIIRKTKDFRKLYEERILTTKPVENIDQLFSNFDHDLTLSLSQFIELEVYMAEFLYYSFEKKKKERDDEIQRLKLSYGTKEEVDEVFSLIDKARLEGLMKDIDTILEVMKEEVVLYKERSELRALYYSLDSKTRVLLQKRWKNVKAGFTELEKERVNHGKSEQYSLLKTALVWNMKSLQGQIETAREKYIQIDIDAHREK